MAAMKVVRLVLWGALLGAMTPMANAEERRTPAGPPLEPATEVSEDTPDLVVGKKVPAFFTYTAAQQAYALPEPWIRKHYVLMEFWSLSTGDRKAGQERMEALRQQFLAEDRLLIWSICIDQDFMEWQKYVHAQKDLKRRDGSRVGFHTDNRWWQLQLGSNSDKEADTLIAQFGLKSPSQFFLIRPGEILAAKHIPAEKVKDVVEGELKGNSN